MTELRIGVLSTARITDAALLDAAESVPSVTVAAVAARDAGRAAAYAKDHGISRSYGSYDDLLADPEIDAIYNPLPNSLHAPWTLNAIAAGKHVLCEKPFALNAAEASRVADAAEASGLVVMEAMHYRYHPLTDRLAEEVASIGPVRNIQCWTSWAIASPADIRWDYALGGGALMDGGCYALDCIRLLAGSSPTVRSAVAQTGAPSVDAVTAAHLELPDGGTAWSESAFTREGAFRADVHVVGDGGHLWLRNFIAAHDGRLLVTKNGKEVSNIPGDGDTTYTGQLRAFCSAITRGTPFPTTARNAVATMRLIDDAYTAASLPPRGTRP
jgi:predicted dehydrogenase